MALTRNLLGFLVMGLVLAIDVVGVGKSTHTNCEVIANKCLSV